MLSVISDMAIGQGRHSDLSGMSYGDLHDTFRSYLALAVGGQWAAIDDARMAGWDDARQAGLDMDAQRRAGLVAAIVKARDIGL